MKEVFKELDKNEFSNFHDFQGYVEKFTRAATARLDAKPLDYWRQMDVKKRAEVLSSYEMRVLSERLLTDFCNYHGWPEHLTGKDMDDDGAYRFAAAIIREMTRTIVYWETLVLTDGRDPETGKELALPELMSVKNDAEIDKRRLRSPHGEMLTIGMGGDAVIRECKYAARKTLETRRENLRRPLVDSIQKYGISQDELCEELELDRQELAEWFRDMYKYQVGGIKEAIKHIKQRRKEDGKRV